MSVQVVTGGSDASRELGRGGRLVEGGEKGELGEGVKLLPAEWRAELGLARGQGGRGELDGDVYGGSPGGGDGENVVGPGEALEDVLVDETGGGRVGFEPLGEGERLERFGFGFEPGQHRV